MHSVQLCAAFRTIHVIRSDFSTAAGAVPWFFMELCAALAAEEMIWRIDCTALRTDDLCFFITDGGIRLVGVDRFGIQVSGDEAEDIIVENGCEIVTEKEGTAVYEKMLDAFDEVLEDYNLTVDDQTYYAGEKRIYAPTFFYVEEGKAVRMTTGISDLLEDPCQDLSDDILADEKQQLDAFFSGTPQA